MRVGRTVQPVSYELRLPDAVQAAALCVLDASRQVINATVAALWERLDDFGERETKYAYKQVTALVVSSDPHGDRQWRCEAEQAGRILRGQARRKKRFALILPLLEQGMILPKKEHTRAGKNRTAIKAALACLRDEHSDGGSEVELQNLIEQTCNYYLAHGSFPDTYEDMQAVPLLKVGILPYAADDGGEHGQAYRFRIDVQGRCCYLAFRFPDEQGVWAPAWTEPQLHLPLPDPVVQRLQAGERLAPTLREIAEPDGTRHAVLDLIIEVPVTALPDPQQVQRVLGWDWGVRTLVTATVLDLEGNRLSPPLFLDTGGFDGRQAHTRRHIDRLKSEGRGKSARGRWVHWRNNTQIRGVLWRCLRYKCHLSGLHLAWQHAAGTTHTCPQCGKPANTYASPTLDAPMLESGAWLRCFECGWNGARDYSAAINIALLGVAYLKQALQTSVSPPDDRPTMTQKGLNSESYSGSGLALRLPPTSPRGRLICSGKIFVNGWVKSVTLHSALPPDHMLRLCG